MAGRWVVEKIDLLNSEDIDYAYTSGYLDEVTFADGTQSTIVYGTNGTSGCTTVVYNDAAANGTHRKKTAYLTNSACFWYWSDSSEPFAVMIGKSDTDNGVFRIKMGYMSGSTFVIKAGSFAVGTNASWKEFAFNHTSVTGGRSLAKRSSSSCRASTNRAVPSGSTAFRSLSARRRHSMRMN
ncbi:MAG: hypothetical protein K8T91_24915 [Planctomycetes bacterium]|nr:hypothetical protein [Planctomycetota bacterium]